MAVVIRLLFITLVFASVWWSPIQAATVLTGRSYEAMVYQAVRNAQERIAVDMPQLSVDTPGGGGPVMSLLRELLMAAVRGVTVEIRCPAGSMPNRVVHALEQQNVAIHARSGDQVFARIVIDDESIVGSHMWTARSLQSSSEVSFLYRKEEQAEWISYRTMKKRVRYAFEKAKNHIAVALCAGTIRDPLGITALPDILMNRKGGGVSSTVLIQQQTVTPGSFHRLFSDREPAVAAAFRLYEQGVPVRLSSPDTQFGYYLVVADDAVYFGPAPGRGYLAQFKKTSLIISGSDAAIHLERFVRSLPGTPVRDMVSYH